MAWETTINVDGVTSTNLIAGADAAGADAGTINVYSAGGEPGVLNSGSAIANGTINVSGGGVANYTVTSGDGRLTVQGGGVVNSTTVAANTTPGVFGLKVNSGGTAYETTVLKNGSMFLSRYASATGVTVSGFIKNSRGMVSRLTLFGSGHVTGDAVISDSIISAGWLHISSAAQAIDMTVRGGGVGIKTGGTANGVTISGGSMTVSVGGAATGVIVNPNGTLNVQSTGSAEVVFNPWQGTINPDEGAEITYLTRDKGVYYGGATAGLIAKNDIFTELTVEAGNSAIVYDDGEMTSTTVAGGDVIVSGSVVSTTVNAGNMYISAGAANSTTVAGGDATVYGGELTAAAVNAGNLYVSGGAADSTTVAGGDVTVYGGELTSTTVNAGNLYVSGGTANSTTVAGGDATVYGGELTSTTVNAGNLYVSGGTANSTTVNGTALMIVRNGGTANSTTVNGTALMIVRNGGTANFVTVNETGKFYVSNAGVANSTIVSSTTVAGTWGLTVSEGGRAYDTTVESGGSMLLRNTAEAEGLNVSGFLRVSGVVSRLTLIGTATIQPGGVMSDSIISGAWGRLSSGATGINTTVKKGAIQVYNGGIASDTTIVSGGSMKLDEGGITEGAITFDLTGATQNTRQLINDLTRVTAGTTLTAKISEWSANDYVIAATGDTTKSITVTDGAATVTLADGDAITNPFAGASYTWNGAKLDGAAYSFTATATAAAALSTDTAASINGGDLAVKWTSATAFTSGNVFLAGATTNGAAAWVELDGYNGGAGTTLYGAQGDAFASGTVNINAKSGSLRNLAAGANAGGTVKAVNLTFAGAELDGTGYAGGFGNVTDEVNTTITTGTFAKDFYAGALANKLTTTTSVGNVSMTVAGGTFDGNIYGASAVKTDSAKGTGTRHTAGDVTLTVTGGSTTKGAQACIFAGGYATGTATGTVYTVASVTAEISGGNWGEAAGGRGVFGGIMASGVEAQVIGNVNITISGDATMGNVYGGGWAQKTGAKSIVGNVNINIEGGTITNVFGGGTHSSSGGTTETGDVMITVSGGDISGAIYARGQLDGDITGAANVIFTGSDGFDCDVFGYSYVGGAASDAHLSFSSYTGEFAGSIGGFDGITFDGATAMTLDTAANDISNGAWEFDLTGRADTLAGTSLLTWSSASFTNDTIKVTFADDAQAQGGWNIATVAEAFSGTTFNVEVGGTEIASGLAYGGQIASGDYAGWGFELESGVLKFKNLASA